MEITSRPKLYSLKDLQPSAEIVKRIKENVSKQQKDVDAVEILKKHIAERLTTDKSSAILNTHDDTIEIKLDDNDSDKKRRRNKDQVIEKISKNLKKSRD
jgi:hypothetical protein